MESLNGRAIGVCLGVALVLLIAPVLRAQDRMPAIPESEMTEAQREAVEEFKAARNTTRFGGPFVPLLRSPEILSRARNVGDYVRFNSALPPRLSEFVILITARHWTQQYEWAVHAPIAEREGLRPGSQSGRASVRRSSTRCPTGGVLTECRKTKLRCTTFVWSCCGRGV